jgi:hypothetical protein
MYSGRVVQDSRRQQHRNGPVVRLYLWKEWNTHTTVDVSSTQVLTTPFSSSHNVHSLPPRIEPLVLLWISKNPTGGFPETHLAISHDKRDLTNIPQLLFQIVSQDSPQEHIYHFQKRNFPTRSSHDLSFMFVVYGFDLIVKVWLVFTVLVLEVHVFLW